MKVLIINGSPHTEGNTALALREMEHVFHSEGVETVMLTVGNQPIRGCIACGGCKRQGKCVFDDQVNQAAQLLAECQGMVVASPVYYASANGTISAFLDRLFFSSPLDKTMKVGASVAVARRGGCTATFDQLNKYFTISGMPIASSRYWNIAYGREPGEVLQDREGLETVRILARNMTFLMKSIALGAAQLGIPQQREQPPEMPPADR